jgi:hypothetical protein
MARTMQINVDSPDPSDAISALLWNLHNAKVLGFTLPNKWMMAEHFLRDDVSVVFYSSTGGIITLAADEEALSSDDAFETVKFVMERVAARRRAKRLEASPLPNAEVEKPERVLPVMPRQKGGLVRAKQMDGLDG